MTMLAADLDGQGGGRGEGGNALQLADGLAVVGLGAGAEMGGDLLEQALDLDEGFIHGTVLLVGRASASLAYDARGVAGSAGGGLRVMRQRRIVRSMPVTANTA